MHISSGKDATVTPLPKPPKPVPIPEGDPRLATLTDDELIVECLDRATSCRDWPLGHKDTQRFVEAATDPHLRALMASELRKAVDTVLADLVSREYVDSYVA